MKEPKMGLTCVYGSRFDTLGMLSRQASLKGSSHSRPAFARALLIVLLALGWSLGTATTTTEVEYYAAEAAVVNTLEPMNIKLYLHNQLNDWDQFVCANELAHRESTWRWWVSNKTTGAYGLFQHMSDHANKWGPYKQIHKHIEYIKKRYKGDWCLALSALERKGWH